SEVARYGSIVRIAPDDFLLVLPPPSSAGDAVIIAQRVLESIAETRAATDLCHAVMAATNTDIVPVTTNSRPFESDPSRTGASTHHSSFHRRNRLPSRARVEAQPAAKDHLRLGTSLGDAVQRHALSIQYQPQF